MDKKLLIGMLAGGVIVMIVTMLMQSKDTPEAIQLPSDVNDMSEVAAQPTQAEVTATEQSEKVISHGVIQGTLSYPSEGIPDDMVVCAEQVDVTNKVCTTKWKQMPGNGSGLGYELPVPAGTYVVYAYLESNAGYKAYYSDFVTCGLSVNCSSHEPIEVEVGANETVEKVNPHDWYAPQPTGM